MTLTSPNCPVAESLPKEVKDGIMQVEGIDNVDNFAELEKVVKDNNKEQTKKSNFIIKRVGDLTHYLTDLKILHDNNSWQQRKNNLKSEIYKSKFSFGFTAWVEKDLIIHLQKWVKNNFNDEISI